VYDFDEITHGFSDKKAKACGFFLLRVLGDGLLVKCFTLLEGDLA